MSPRRTWTFLAVLAAFIGTAALSMVTPRRSVGAAIALAAAGVMTFLAWQRARKEQDPINRATGATNAPLDPSRRRFMAAAGALSFSLLRCWLLANADDIQRWGNLKEPKGPTLLLSSALA